MSFDVSKEKAEKWIKTSSFDISGIVESEGKLAFVSKNSPNVTFWVSVPQENNDWTIWSENEDVCPKLSEAIDLASSGRPVNITDILEKVQKSLKKLLEGSEESDDDCDYDEEEDEDEGHAGYYEDADDDVYQEDPSIKPPDSDEESAVSFFTGGGSSTAVHRLLADFKLFKKSQGKFGVQGGPKEDNLFQWDVKLTDFPKDTLLGKDLLQYAKTYKEEPVVSMEMKFPKEYPMTPPFVRVVKPRFKFLTGHVTLGGSVCMEMLTRSGWRPTNDIESILVQIRAEIMSDKNTQLDKHKTNTPYSEHDAKVAFERMVAKYGWNK